MTRQRSIWIGLGFLVVAGLAAEPAPAMATAGRTTPHWAFQPLQLGTVPTGEVDSTVSHPIDAFVVQRLRPAGLTLSPEASRSALVRRLSLDLTGLPPSPEEVDAFEHDPHPDAYERLVDRLLASPHFGEFWGRHWLDAAGYSDVMGGDNDAGTVKFAEGKWRYRDYVVRSFNSDIGFDRFVTEQLAGDELVDWRHAASLPDLALDALIATTFLRQASDDTDENELNTPDIRHDIVHRTVEMAANNLLGLTLNCARCHDHKYDPVSQRDYYAFAAHFMPAFNPESWLQPKDRNLPDVAPGWKSELVAANESIERQSAALRARRDAVLNPVRDRLREDRLVRLPPEMQRALREALGTASDRRSESQRKLVENHEASVATSSPEVRDALDARQRADVEAVEAALSNLASARRSWKSLHAVYDTGPAPATHVLRRGEFNRPAEVVDPAFPVALRSKLDSGGSPTVVGRPAAPAGTSGRRLALARWLSAPGTPASALVARVQVNRVWQHLFGVGLVETSENFGVMGSAPSHPELLDWLASDWVRGGWQWKRLIRAIVTSRTYRQASATPEGPRTRQAIAIDPGNRLLWHQRLRRMESGSVRDALLVVADECNAALGGPPIPVEAHSDGMVVLKPAATAGPGEANRRSLYVLARRNYTLSLLNTFDEPVMTQNCTRRQSSAVVSQSLTLLNDSLILECADRFATRVEREEVGSGDTARLQRAFRVALGRSAATDELELCLRTLNSQRERHRDAGATPDGASHRALANVCHMLLNTSEFLSIP